MPACVAVTASGAKQTLAMKKSRAGKNADAKKREVAIASFFVL